MPTPDDFIRVTGQPVAGVSTPGYMLPQAPPMGAPALDVPNYAGGAPLLDPSQAPALPAAPPAGPAPTGIGPIDVPGDPATAPRPAAPAAPATPTQFVSRPQQQSANPADLLKVVGNVSTGTQTSTTSTDLGKAGKDAAKAFEESQAQSLKAGEARIAYDRERAQFETEAAKAKLALGEQAKADLQTQYAKNSEELRKKAADIDASVADLEKEANNISGDRWWQEQSTGAKIGGLIAIALSGLGQVFQAKGGNVNTRNAALDMIQQQVDRDIDAQKTRLAAKERGIRVKESAYSRAREAGADELEAREAAAAANYKQIDRELAVKQASISDKDAQARLEELRAGVAAKAQEHQQRMAELLARKTTTQTGSRPVTGLEVAQLGAAANAAQQEAYRQEHGLLKKDPSLATPEGQAKSAAAYKEWTERTLAQEPAERALQVLKGTIGKGSDKLDPAKRAAIGNARAAIAAYLRSPAGRNTGAAMSEGEKEMLLDPSLPDDTWLQRASGRFEATIKALDQDFKGNRKAWASTYGGRTE